MSIFFFLNFLFFEVFLFLFYFILFYFLQDFLRLIQKQPLPPFSLSRFCPVLNPQPGNTNGGSITVPLTSC